MQIWWSKNKVVVLIFIAALAFNALPHFYQRYFASPSDKVYVSSFPIIYDKSVYLSAMMQGYEGSWKFLNKFTSEPHEGMFIYILYIFLGHIAKFFGISIETMFFVSRFVFGSILFLVIVYFIRYFVKNEFQRTFAYLLVFFGSGLGWLGFSRGSIDLWMPDAIPLVRISHFPHMLFANALLALAFLFFYKSLRSNESNNDRYAVIAGVAAFVLNIVLPFHSMLLYPAIFLFLIIYIIITRKIIPSCRKAFYFFALSLPSFLWMAYFGLFHSVESAVYSAHSLPPPPVWDFILGYGLLLFLGIFGLYVMHKQENKHLLLFAVWVFTAIIFSYAFLLFMPFSKRIMETGLYIPLAVAASFGMLEIYRRLIIKFQGLFFRIALEGVLLWFLISGNFVNLFQFIETVHRIDSPQLYLPKENIEAMKWLKQNSPVDSIILSSFFNANVIPYFSDRTVYIGHGAATVNFEHKLGEAEKFYSGDMVLKEMADFLERNSLDYVFFSDLENVSTGFFPEHYYLSGLRKISTGFLPEKYDFLQKVYENKKVSVFKFSPPSSS